VSFSVSLKRSAKRGNKDNRKLKVAILQLKNERRQGEKASGNKIKIALSGSTNGGIESKSL